MAPFTRGKSLALLEEHGFDVNKPIVAFANLATGEPLRSPPLVRGGPVKTPLASLG